ncbi:tRNA uridine-5-carboxymethylaminomethyl(34) synthesis GTPase MnmE [Stenotrophobium rhamnosiphilum]|uniref:tRNA modification GTPase MnmE n=1 Tax=Stenotrophobium rhamnosiphilum TaxID=2029166 RepID=A0A2T5MFN4_9GAMM|nr:tRNA uridine-5-carboxymethylaminomethyl(34) synthesis GTPase MnmE [Stenotrophobium rhamnosiphilum]PTU31384.1 tRNA uridine-5-carboxymethylaminomethyl(34) synthesis GTPase MnmE [Stenotrophobium rhamnosiphilum]
MQTSVKTNTETIAAVATPPGRGALGILRLSGPKAAHIAEQIAGTLPKARQAALRHFRDPHGTVIDQGLLLYFPGPNSFTGEDVVELQGHGGPVLLDLLLRSVCALGARVARPGEFSERAFLNNRIDLAQAEAIADLIDAASAQAARAASRSLDGEFSKRIHALVDELIQLRVFIEGALDFSDEDIDWLADDKLRTRLATLIEHLHTLITQAARGRRLREGITVTLTGQPNVGKSTLLNRLAGSDAAIVTEIAGTTRDVLRENIVLDDLPLTVVDTAGLRESDDPVEREGIRRAWAALAQAEIALYLVDDRVGITPEDQALLRQLPTQLKVLVIANKCDLSGHPPNTATSHDYELIRLSAADGAGMELLTEAIKRIAGVTDNAEGIFSARTRHVDALRRALAFSQDAQARLLEGVTPELAAEELRLAQEALAEITGQFSSDDLLGKIFSQFCIGK